MAAMTNAAGAEWTHVVKGDPSARAGHPDEPTGGRLSDASFAEAFVGQIGRLKRVIAGMGFGASDGEDILHDVFVEASERPGEYRGPEDAANWLMRVAVNRCLLEFRRRQRFRRAAAEILRRGSTAAEAISRTSADAPARIEELEAVRQALAELDDSLLCPLVLRYFCGLDSSRIGEILEMPPATVRGRLRDGRMKLAKRLMERGIGP